jgi:membrane protein
MRSEAMDGDAQREDLYDQPIKELIKRLSRETAMLVRQEVDLAKTELAQKGKSVGLGAGMFGGAGAAGYAALLSFTACVIAALSLAMAVWLAALIVGIVWLIAAAIMAAMAGRKMRESMPPVPEEAMASIREDVRTAASRLRRGATG